MRLTRTFTPLVAAVCIAAAAPASSSGRPMTDVVPVKPHIGRCYQLNPIAPGQPRGRHRVLCGDAGALVPTGDLDEATVSALRSQTSGGDIPWDTIALGVAAAALALSAAAVTDGRRRARRRHVGVSRTLMINREGHMQPPSAGVVDADETPWKGALQPDPRLVQRPAATVWHDARPEERP